MSTVDGKWLTANLAKNIIWDKNWTKEKRILIHCLVKTMLRKPNGIKIWMKKKEYNVESIVSDTLPLMLMKNL